MPKSRPIHAVFSPRRDVYVEQLRLLPEVRQSEPTTGTNALHGGLRSKTEAAIMKAEGMTAGAADLLLLVPRGGFGSLGIEFKTQSKGSRQSEAQKRWQAAFENAGNKYTIVRTFEEAVVVTNRYLQL